VTGRWFATEPLAAAAVQLVCVPHAGAGASAYRDWQERLGPEIEVLPVQLPGREARFGEPLVRSVSGVVDELVGPVLERVRGPVAVFGHSMGALIGYELAHALAERGHAPVHLFASGYPAPHLPHVGPALHTLPEQEFQDHIVELQGTASEVLDHPELMGLLLRVLKADYELCETYRHPERPAFAVPVTALGGEQDPDTEGERLARWEDLSTGRSTARWFSGGHFYLHHHLDELMAIIEDTLLGTGREHGGSNDGSDRPERARTANSRVLPTS